MENETDIDEKTLELLETIGERFINSLSPKLPEPKMVLMGIGSITNDRMIRELSAFARQHEITVVMPKHESNIPGSNIHFDPFNSFVMEVAQEEHKHHLQVSILKHRVLKEPIIKSKLQIPMNLNIRKK